MNQKKVKQLAREMGFRDIRSRGRWDRYEVFEPTGGDAVENIGLPELILADGEIARMAAPEEVFAYLDSLPEEDEPTGRPVRKSDPNRFDQIVEVEKFNPYHDSKGRFSSGNGATSFTFDPGKSKAHDKAITRAKATDRDLAAVSEGIRKVRNMASNDVRPLKREDADIDAIMQTGGCDRKTAEQAAARAKALYDKAAEAEPGITKDIVSAVSSSSGKMYGLDFRMKQETSLGRKIVKDAKHGTNGVLDKAAANIKDAMRYTAVFESADFAAGYQNVKKALEAKGYKEERCKNFYEKYKKGEAPQKSVQCVFSDGHGNRMELQFHTYESQGAKEVNHPLYERHRAANTKYAQKAELDRQMKAISASVPDPDGVYDIGSHG